MRIKGGDGEGDRVGSNNNYIKYNKCLHMYENLWYLTTRVHRLSNLFAFGLAKHNNALGRKYTHTVTNIHTMKIMEWAPLYAGNSQMWL